MELLYNSIRRYYAAVALSLSCMIAVLVIAMPSLLSGRSLHLPSGDMQLHVNRIGNGEMEIVECTLNGSKMSLKDVWGAVSVGQKGQDNTALVIHEHDGRLNDAYLSSIGRILVACAWRDIHVCIVRDDK